MPSLLNSTELRAVEGQPIDLTSTDSPALSIISAKQIEPALEHHAPERGTVQLKKARGVPLSLTAAPPAPRSQWR